MLANSQTKVFNLNKCIAMTTIDKATIIIGKLGRDARLKLGIEQDDKRPIVFNLHHVNEEERRRFARPGKQFIL